MSNATGSTAQLKAVATGAAAPNGKALAEMKPKEQIAHLLKQKQAEITKLLPKHLNAERLLKVAQIAATATPGLLECDVPSLIGAIGQCAQLGLEPNTVLGHAYLVPFNTKRKDNQGRERWVKSVQVVIGYKGLIDLARRSGQIVSIAAHEVCAYDHFDMVYGLDERLEHKPELGDRGEVIGFYAVAKLKDGGHSFEFMSTYQVREIMESTQSKGKYGPWKDHFVEMGRKTVIRRLAKYLPLSIEFQTAAALDTLAAGEKDQKLDTIDGEFMVLPEEPGVYVEEGTGEIHGRLSDEAIVNLPDTAEQHAEADLRSSQPTEVKGSKRSAPKQKTFAQFVEDIDNAAGAEAAALVLDSARDVLTPSEVKELEQAFQMAWKQ